MGIVVFKVNHLNDKKNQLISQKQMIQTDGQSINLYYDNIITVQYIKNVKLNEMFTDQSCLRLAACVCADTYNLCFQVQRYEGASTIYGPHTLSAYLQKYRGLARAIAQV